MPLPTLRISDDRRHLVTEGGHPFLYLADTAWELFHRLDRESADLYLRDRAAKGFNVIQAVALAEINGLTEPNPYGYLPLVENNPARPVEEYFQHVDWIVKRAGELGIYIALLPTWGDKWNQKWGVGPEIFTPENAWVYGEWLGRRYQNAGVIWVLGGDRPIETETHRAILRAMAEGLKAGDSGRHLITFHPPGGASSSKYVADETWLDFHMAQSGHGDPNDDNSRFVTADRALEPVRPTLDGEPRYEDLGIFFWEYEPKPGGWASLTGDFPGFPKGIFSDYDVRRAAYWSLLAGACGHTYGCNNIWQMWEPGRTRNIPALHTWQESLALPGAAQVGFLRRLFECFPWQKLEPAADLLWEPGDLADANRPRTARANDRSFAFVYLAIGNPITLRPEQIVPEGGKFSASWFDPRTTAIHATVGTVAGEGIEFTPPTVGPNNDWLLILEVV